MLPCPEFPAEKPEGGWFWYDMENSRYKCPNGLMFADGNYPYWYSNCTPAKVWDPEEVENCIRKFLKFICRQILVKNWIFADPFHKKEPLLVILVLGLIQPSESVIFLMK